LEDLKQAKLNFINLEKLKKTIEELKEKEKIKLQ
jgi:hypothetical protein